VPDKEYARLAIWCLRPLGHLSNHQNQVFTRFCPLEQSRQRINPAYEWHHPMCMSSSHICAFTALLLCCKAGWMIADTEFGEHLPGMFSGLAAGANWSGSGAAEFPWQPINIETAPMRCIDFDDMAVLKHLRMVAELVKTHNRAVGHFFLDKP